MIKNLYHFCEVPGILDILTELEFSRDFSMEFHENPEGVASGRAVA